MKYTIRTGSHRGWPFAFGIFRNKKVFERDVYFDNSCKYSLEGQDQFDVNKIFGLGYFWNHHKYSVRFGWRYDRDKELIVLSGYVYDRGERMIAELCDVNFFRWMRLRISINDNKYSFQVFDSFSEWRSLGFAWLPKTHSKQWSYRLGFFFGGNKPSPNKMHILLKK